MGQIFTRVTTHSWNLKSYSTILSESLSFSLKYVTSKTPALHRSFSMHVDLDDIRHATPLSEYSISSSAEGKPKGLPSLILNLHLDL